jgi:hypothetical protein
MEAESLVEGRLRLMNHNLKFETYKNNEYHNQNRCVGYDSIYGGIWNFLEKEVSNLDFSAIGIYSPLPILFEEFILTTYQFIHYGFH